MSNTINNGLSLIDHGGYVLGIADSGAGRLRAMLAGRKKQE